MNDFLNTLTRWTVRLVLLMVGVVFFLSLMALVCVLALAWGVRSLWAKLTGRPVTPWSMPMRAGSNWAHVFQGAGHFGARAAKPATHADEQPSATPFTPAASSKRGGILSKVASDISDVPVREVTER